MIGLITGEHRLRRMRDQAHDYARAAYDPSIYAPSIDQARRVATEGIGVERMGEDVLGRIMRGSRDPEAMAIAGTAGRALAATGAADEARMRAMTDAYGQLYTRDQQARMEAEQREAGLMAAARQTAGQREAAMHHADMTFEAERGRRRQDLLASGLGLAGEFILPGVGTAIRRGMAGAEATPSPTRLELFDDDIIDAPIDVGEDLFDEGLSPFPMQRTQRAPTPIRQGVVPDFDFQMDTEWGDIGTAPPLTGIDGRPQMRPLMPIQDMIDDIFGDEELLREMHDDRAFFDVAPTDRTWAPSQFIPDQNRFWRDRRQ